MQEFFGDTICVNGKAAPFLEVEPRKYRFRMVNGSNSRFFHLTLVPADAAGKPNGKPVDAPPFRQIGTDGGLLPAPLSMHYLIFSPGERFDLIIDFSEHKGENLALINDAPAPYARGGEIVPSDVMLFKVIKPFSGKDSSSLPDTLVTWSPLDPAHAVRERTLALTEMDRPSDGYTMIGLLGQKHWDDPITREDVHADRQARLHRHPHAARIERTPRLERYDQDLFWLHHTCHCALRSAPGNPGQPGR
jgi:spore coat protein A